MSRRYIGGLVSASTTNTSDLSASGIWTIEQAMQLNAAGSWPPSTSYVDRVFSAYTYTGNGTTNIINNGIALADSSIFATDVSSSSMLSAPLAASGIAYGAGIYVVSMWQATSPYITSSFATSTDGVSWTSRGGLASATWFGIAFGASNFVIISQDTSGSGGASSLAYYSSNGINWTTSSGYSSSSASNKVRYVNGRFIATAQSTSTIHQSTNDGVTWTTLTVPTGNWYDVTYGNNIYILVSQTAGTSGICYSSDLSSWTTVTTSIALYTIAYGAGIFVAGGPSGIITSTNGASWTSRLSGVSFYDIVYNGTDFVAVTDNGVFTSINGIDWSTQRSTINATSLRRICYGNGKNVVIAGTNGNSSVVTITNTTPSIIGNPGLVWIKNRDRATSGHALAYGSYLLSTSGNQGYWAATAGSQGNAGSSAVTFLSNGFSLSTDTAHAINNYYTEKYISWTFRKAPKFFDVVTWTGDGIAGRTIAHSLGQAPGMIIVKCTSTSTNWIVYHRSLGATKALFLNSTSAETVDSYWNNTEPTNSTFTVTGTGWSVNNSGATYVAYLFAHDTATDGIIQCGSFTQSGSNLNISLGWEPQFIMAKRTDNIGDWVMFDTTRGLTVNADEVAIKANLTNSENAYGAIKLTSTGFTALTTFGYPTTYIYIAIRRSNKLPTSGTQVFNAIARTGTGAAATITGMGFAPDMMLGIPRSITIGDRLVMDRLRGRGNLLINNTNAEANSVAGYDYVTLDPNGFSVGLNQYGNVNYSGAPIINYAFKRAPGVFDVVSWTGDSATNLRPHSLGVKPELLIMKQRNSISNWEVAYLNRTTDYALKLNLTDAADVGATNTFSVGTNNTVFSATLYTPFYTNGNTYVAYLFATKAGISKVSNYIGNGLSQIIDCGFPTTARFILIKRIDSTGDWYVWDYSRGIVSGTDDPHISLNTNSMEITTDNSISPYSSGFIVNQVSATNINVASATYIYLSFS